MRGQHQGFLKFAQNIGQQFCVLLARRGILKRCGIAVLSNLETLFVLSSGCTHRLKTCCLAIDETKSLLFRAISRTDPAARRNNSIQLLAAILYSTLLYSTLLYSTILYHTILYYAILWCRQELNTHQPGSKPWICELHSSKP